MRKSEGTPGAAHAKLTQIMTLLLGGAWLLDGILQLQPAMFTSAFATQVLAPQLAGEPRFVAALIAFGMRAANWNPMWFNIFAAGIQLAIGLLLVLPLRRNTRRFGLWLSAAWALIIWIFGEAFGGIATGSATFYMGAPGAALAYLILALLLLKADDRPQVFKRVPMILGGIFLFGAGLNALPMFWQPSMLSMLAGISSISTWLGTFGAQGTMIGNLIAIDALAALGVFLIFLPNRAVAWTTLAFLLLVWIIGQNFGGIQTFPGGFATDPNSAPLLALFVLPLFYKNHATKL